VDPAMAMAAASAVIGAIGTALGAQVQARSRQPEPRQSTGGVSGNSRKADVRTPRTPIPPESPGLAVRRLAAGSALLAWFWVPSGSPQRRRRPG
jgi:hypothetical protein